jgi:hypothetical protein
MQQQELLHGLLLALHCVVSEALKLRSSHLLILAHPCLSLDQCAGELCTEEWPTTQIRSQGDVEERMGRNGDADAMWFRIRSIARDMCIEVGTARANTLQTAAAKQEAPQRRPGGILQQLPPRPRLRQAVAVLQESRTWVQYAAAALLPPAHLPAAPPPSPSLASSVPPTCP